MKTGWTDTAEGLSFHRDCIDPSWKSEEELIEGGWEKVTTPTFCFKCKGLIEVPNKYLIEED